MISDKLKEVLGEELDGKKYFLIVEDGEGIDMMPGFKEVDEEFTLRTSLATFGGIASGIIGMSLISEDKVDSFKEDINGMVGVMLHKISQTVYGQDIKDN